MYTPPSTGLSHAHNRQGGEAAAAELVIPSFLGQKVQPILSAELFGPKSCCIDLRRLFSPGRVKVKRRANAWATLPRPAGMRELSMSTVSTTTAIAQEKAARKRAQ